MKKIIKTGKKRSKLKNEILGDYSHEEPWIVEMLQAHERGELVSIPNFKKVKAAAQQAANNHMQKQARINIRLSNADLAGLRYKAEEEGLPYQTLIASILHKYVSGRLVAKE